MLSLLYRESGTLTRIGEVRLDAAVREEHVASARVTESPVESGAKVSDHVFLEPETLNIDGVITDTPVYLHPASANEDDGLLTVPLASSGSRAIDAFEALRRLLSNREPLTVVTGLRVYSNMVMTNLNVPREPESGLALRFSCELRQVQIVQSQTIPPNKAAPKKKKKAQKTAKRGKQSTKEVSKPSTLPPAVDVPYIDAWEMEQKKQTPQVTLMPGLLDPSQTVGTQDNLIADPVIIPQIRPANEPIRPHIGHGHRIEKPSPNFRVSPGNRRSPRF